MKFKKGDKIEYLEASTESLTKGKVYTVIGLDMDDDPRFVDNNGEESYEYAYNFKLVSKSGKKIEENLVRYMAYGTGCDNKSDIFQNEKELKEKLKRLVKDSDWSGRIIGYKLTPIYEAVEEVKLKVFKKTKIVKHGRGRPAKQ